MSRMILRDESIRCDVCNRKGAFDFYGDFYCEHCLTEDENGHTSVTSEHRLKYTEELEALNAELVDALEEYDKKVFLLMAEFHAQTDGHDKEENIRGCTHPVCMVMDAARSKLHVALRKAGKDV